jgi:hypothetical protein
VDAVNNKLNSQAWIFFSRHQVTQGKKKRTRLTVGGNQIEYPGDKSTCTAGLTTAYQQRHINKMSKIPGDGYKKFYLITPLTRFEYMVINISSLPQEIIEEFGLLELAHDD